MSLVYRINTLNIGKIKFETKQRFEGILFDSVLTCNLHCLYCHNNRSLNRVSKEELAKFITEQVESVENFQLGCAMEPTMDRDMGKIAILISQTNAFPKKIFRLQTNGILLDRHDLNELKEAKINVISISLDTLDDVIHKEMRGGSDLEKIKNNIINLRRQWPELKIILVTTVNKLNIKKLEDVVKFALDNGINGINFRKMYHHPESNMIQNHDRMREILLSDPEFNVAVQKLKRFVGKKITINSMDYEKYHDNRIKVVF